MTFSQPMRQKSFWPNPAARSFFFLGGRRAGAKYHANQMMRTTGRRKPAGKALSSILSTVLVIGALCGRAATSTIDFQEAAASITAADLLRHTKTLSSDEFEGRAPGGKGEELTVDYLTEQF